MRSQEKKLKVYYDGLCKVCSAEINHYMRQPGSEYIEFIDICSSQFDAVSEDVDPVQVHKVMHVRLADGTLATRVDAFIEIWKILPKYAFLAKMATLVPVRAALAFGYSGFALVRPFLPRKVSSSECKDSPYCSIEKSVDK